MEKFLNNQQIPLVRVIDPSTGQEYYAPEATVYDDRNGPDPTILKSVIVDQANTASYFDGRVVSASYALTASYLEGGVASASYATTASYAHYAETASSALNAQDILIYVKNQSGNTIAKGVVVHITASGNSSDIPRVITASYENDNNSANTLGITNQSIANGADGFVMTEGVLKGIDTNAFISGQLIYLGATGSIIGYAPQAPLHSVRLGQVVRHQSNNGSIYVRIDNGYELEELHDVLIISASSGDLLIRSGSVWTNSRQLTGSYAITGSLTATSFTGSFSGSGTITSASFARTASYVNTLVQNVSISGTLDVSSPYPYWSNGTPPDIKLNTTTGIAGILQIAGDSTIIKLWQSSGAGNGMAINSAYSGPGAHLSFGRPSEGGGAVFMYIVRDTGNVLINTATDAGYKLDVNGSARSTAFRLTDNTLIAAAYTVGGTTLTISNGGHNNATGINVTSAVGIQAFSSLGASNNNVLGASIYAAGGRSGTNISLGLLSNRALISSGNALTMHTSSMLQVDSTTQGFLPPRTNLTSNISTPAQGLMTYLTGSTNEGLYYYSSGSIKSWTRLLNDTGSQVIGTGSLSINTSTTSSALNVYKSGSTVLDIQGSQGQLFSVTDALSGSLMSVNDVSGLPILEVFSDDRVVMGTYGTPGLTVSGSTISATGSLLGTASLALTSSYVLNAVSASFARTASYVNPLTQSILLSGSLNITGEATNQISLSRTIDDTSPVFIKMNNGGIGSNTGGTISFPYGSITGKYAGITITNSGFNSNSLSLANGNTLSWSGNAFNFGTSGNSTISTSGLSGTSMTFQSGGSFVYNSFASGPGFRDVLKISQAGNLQVGGFTDTARLEVKGSGTTSATTTLLVQNANASASLQIRDDGSSTFTYPGVAGYFLKLSGAYSGNGISAVYETLGGTGAYYGIHEFKTGTNVGSSARTLSILYGGRVVLGNKSNADLQNPKGNLLIDTNFVNTFSGAAPESTAFNTGIVINPTGSINTQITASGIQFNFAANNPNDVNGGAFIGAQWNPLVGGYDTDLVVYATQTNAGSYNEIARFVGKRKSLSLGAGRNPSASLHISGASNFALLEIDSPTLNNILYVSGSGNIGIGTGTPNARLQISGSNPLLRLNGSGSELMSVDGASGRLFTVSDDLTNSLFSVNTIAGLPVIEAFATNDVYLGKYGVYPIKTVTSGTLAVITGSLLGTASFATSASWAPSSPAFPFTGSARITGSLNVIGDTVITGSFKIKNGTTPVMDTTLGYLYDTYGNASVSFGGYQLINYYGINSVNWGSYYLIGSSGNISVDWDNRILNDSTGAARLRWNSTGVQVTGSFIVSGSSTLINIGPAEFSGSVSLAQTYGNSLNLNYNTLYFTPTTYVGYNAPGLQAYTPTQYLWQAGTDAYAKFASTGNVFSRGANVSPSKFLYLYDSVNSDTTIKIEHSNFLGSATAELGVSRIGSIVSLYATSNSALRFGTNNTEQMRIFAGGNVALGTTIDAGYKLDVNGTGRFTDNVYLATTSGSVGVGTTSPAQKFDVSAGHITTYDSSVKEGKITFNNNASALRWDQLTQKLHLTVATRDKLTIDNNGLVGINQISPSYELDVSGSINTNTGLIVTGSLNLNGSDISSSWISYTPTWTTDATQPTLGDGTLTGAYKVVGKTCFVRVRLVWGTTTNSGTGAFYFNLPVTSSSTWGVQFPCSILDNGNAWYQATVNGEYGGFTNKTALIGQSAGGANSSQGITGVFPFTFGNLDSIQFNGSYEIA